MGSLKADDTDRNIVIIYRNWIPFATKVLPKVNTYERLTLVRTKTNFDRNDINEFNP